jgi:hypothetical protein
MIGMKKMCRKGSVLLSLSRSLTTASETVAVHTIDPIEHLESPQITKSI